MLCMFHYGSMQKETLGSCCQYREFTGSERQSLPIRAFAFLEKDLTYEWNALGVLPALVQSVQCLHAEMPSNAAAIRLISITVKAKTQLMTGSAVDRTQ